MESLIVGSGTRQGNRENNGINLQVNIIIKSCGPQRLYILFSVLIDKFIISSETGCQDKHPLIGIVLGRRWFIMRIGEAPVLCPAFDAFLFLSAFLLAPLQLKSVYLASQEEPTVCDPATQHPSSAVQFDHKSFGSHFFSVEPGTTVFPVCGTNLYKTRFSLRPRGQWLYHQDSSLGLLVISCVTLGKSLSFPVAQVFVYEMGIVKATASYSPEDWIR